MPWLPSADSKPPAIDLTLYKPIDVTPEQGWIPVEEFWRPGIKKFTGYHLPPNANGHEAIRVGTWTHYDPYGRTLFIGSWNKNGVPIGPHVTYVDPTKTPLNLREGSPLPIAKIEVFGARVLVAAEGEKPNEDQPLLSSSKRQPLAEQINFDPQGNVRMVGTFGATGAKAMGFHPKRVIRSNSLDGPIVGGTSVVEARVSNFMVEVPEKRLRYTSQFSLDGVLLEAKCEPTRPYSANDPDSWSVTWNHKGHLDSLKKGASSWHLPAQPSGFDTDKAQQVVVWADAQQPFLGIRAIGFSIKDQHDAWTPAGTWTIYAGVIDAIGRDQILASGTFKDGKPEGEWTENRFAVVKGSQKQIENGRGMYLSGKRHGLWRFELSEGHEELTSTGPVFEHEARPKLVTYANGVVTTTDPNGK